ncbi:MAG TPA: TetR/AcrR family transcriptional regulator [Vicinamibacterales bacterium]|jgi:AcrR family transcriptional regulator
MPELHRRTPRPRRKPTNRYHHGDLRHALLQEAVRTIGADGVEALTLREVGEHLGVSRTALYRHFRNKGALLAAVAREGFQRFRQDLLTAWTEAGEGRDGLAAMGVAYVRFALDNPSHYRVMFGRFRDLCGDDPGLIADGNAAFDVLVAALTSILTTESKEPPDVTVLAPFVWATVHGVAMLGIDGQLGPDRATVEALSRFTVDRLRTMRF